jgi:signal transduction histidine kinase
MVRPLDAGAVVAHPPEGSCDHVMGFYEQEEFLVDSVARFLAPALASEGAGVVIATPEHRGKIEAALAETGIAVEELRADSRLVSVDAAATLERFMSDGAPDAGRFRSVASELLDRVGDREVRVYGEMVALLWEDGNVSGTVALEDLWNRLGATRAYTLFCSYPMDAFADPDTSEAFRAVCEKHTGVIPSESYSQLAGADERLRAVVLLQQEAAAGHHERSALRRKQSELEAALERLREADRLRKEFVAMVVHDIRSPVAVVSGFLDLLLETWQELDADQIRDCLTRSIENTEQIERLASDILMMSRLDSGKLTYDLRPVDLGRLVEGAACRTHGSTGRTIEVLREPNLRPALADEKRQLQILDNLLSNAVKFSPEHTPVQVQVADRGDHLEVSIHDEGVGIDPDEHHKLFRPFARLGRRSEAATKGTGLGLYIAKALIEGQGGTIAVASTPGGGARFTYTVPTATPPA